MQLSHLSLSSIAPNARGKKGRGRKPAITHFSGRGERGKRGKKREKGGKGRKKKKAYEGGLRGSGEKET